MHGVDTRSVKPSPGSPEPTDNFSIILEAPQVSGYSFGSDEVYRTGNNVLKSEDSVPFR